MLRFTLAAIPRRRFFCITERYLSNDSQTEVRVRFAPSPTGSLHLGGLRTAFYNYIYAKKYGGKFVLRIEDTDQSRTVKGSADEIEQLLIWFGLRPDEGPKQGGPFGPYIQSERVDLYRQKAAQLIESGRAYRCFCSPDRLNLLKIYQSRNREIIHYDRKCYHLSQAEVREKLKENNGRHVIRFALAEGSTEMTDMIFGPLTANLIEAKESDPIILKSDLFPTYHFANIIDDHYMQITHVLRGSEWISSMAKHIQLYEAFNWKIPTFAHFPLITMEDGSKMSKRNNQSHVVQLKAAGFRPLAILNLLTNIGGGLPKSKQDSNDLWSIERIIEEFNFDTVTRHPGGADKSRLDIYNSKDLKRTLKENPTELQVQMKTLLNESGINTNISDDLIIEAISRNIDRITTINDLVAAQNMYLWQQPDSNICLLEYKNKGLNIEVIVRDIIELVRAHKIDDKSALKAIAIKHGVEWPMFLRFIRKILTNSDKGLPVHDIIKCLGEDRLLKYLSKYSDPSTF